MHFRILWKSTSEQIWKCTFLLTSNSKKRKTKKWQKRRVPKMHKLNGWVTFPNNDYNYLYIIYWCILHNLLFLFLIACNKSKMWKKKLESKNLSKVYLMLSTSIDWILREFEWVREFAGNEGKKDGWTCVFIKNSSIDALSQIIRRYFSVLIFCHKWGSGLLMNELRVNWGVSESAFLNFRNFFSPRCESNTQNVRSNSQNLS